MDCAYGLVNKTVHPISENDTSFFNYSIKLPQGRAQKQPIRNQLLDCDRPWRCL